MLASEAQYRLAVRVVAELERRDKLGIASDAERNRLQAGCEELLCYEWEHEGRQGRRVSNATWKTPDLPSRDPRAIRIIDWWDANKHRHPDAMWLDAFYFWILPLDLEAADLVELYEATSEEYHERAHRRARREEAA